MKDIRILLLEDSDTDLLLLQQAVSANQGLLHELIHVKRLSDGIDLIKTTTFDILLVDLGLPDSQGLETFQVLYRLTPTTPIVVLTESSNEEVGEKALKEGAQDYLVKSQISGPILQHSIRCAMERHRFSASSRYRANELAESEIRLRRLVAGLEAVDEAERTRLSREIHNDLEQLLTAIKMDLRWVERRLLEPLSDGMGALGERILEVQRLMDQTIEWVQRISLEMRPSVLDSLGLSEALLDEARRFEKRTEICVNLEVPESLPKLNTDIRTALFRIFQELLTNIHRHAQASGVDVSLLLDGPILELRLKDNGMGIQQDQIHQESSIGILRMKERAISLGGEIRWEGSPKLGTLAVVRIPYRLA